MTDARDLSALPPMAELVPHEPPMLLVDALLDWTPTRARVAAKIRAGGPFVTDGRMPASFCLEYMAQAVAAAKGAARYLDSDADTVAGAAEEGEAGRPERPPIGVLLGSRELRLQVEELAVGVEIEIAVEREFDDGKLARYACELRRAPSEGEGEGAGTGELLAAASLTVMIGGEGPDGGLGKSAQRSTSETS